MSSCPQKKVDPPNQENEDDFQLREAIGMVRNLRKLTREDWTNGKELLWKKYIEFLRFNEEASLELLGLPPKSVQKLVRSAWVRRDKDSGVLVVENTPSEDSSDYVPVILVNRDGGFAIQAEILSYLEGHPLLSVSGEVLPDQDDQACVFDALEEVEALSEELGFGYNGLHHLCGIAPDCDGVTRRLGDYGYAAHRLQCLLDTEYRESDASEDVQWLTVAKNGERFWKLLNTALTFGQMKERRQILDVQKGEEVLRRLVTTPPGKNTSEIGEAMERMIEAYTLGKGSSPTASQLLGWLKSERPPSDRSPLVVNHDMWTNAMPKVSWPQFQQLVKDAKRRMNR